MSAHHPNVARRQSKSSDEPYLYESFTKAYDNGKKPDFSEGHGNYTQQDCLRLAKTLTDMAQVPVPCKEVVQKELAVRKAFEGASVTDRARQAIASRKGSVSHHQLQRRLTRTSEVMSR